MNLTTTKQAAQNIFSRLNWKIYPSTLFSIITLLSILPCVLFLPEKYAWENSYIENAQNFIILAMFICALKATRAKQLFNWIAMVIVMLFLREINCGRIFFSVSEDWNPPFKPWREILPSPYNHIPNALFGLFILYAIYYFFKSRAYLQLWTILKQAKIDCWNIIFMGIGGVLGTLAEISVHSEMLEETTETLFYVAFGVLIYLYGQSKDYNVKGLK
ncbi:MAG: hypothetical protein K6F04_02630 [bacterium]|nr:hypothetical protein [bacterium]